MYPTIKKWLLRFPIFKSFYAQRVKAYRTKAVVNVLRLAHAQELAKTSADQWGLVQQRQALEIMAVRDGKLDIVDRRSYPWPYLPLSVGRTPQPVIKFSPSNIRRFAMTPVPRRAINLVKGAISSLKWDIVPVDGDEGDASPDTQQRINAVRNSFAHPNNSDTFQTLIEVGVDDLCTLGAMVLEPQITPSVDRPIKLWNVDSSTIRIYPSWKESTPDRPHYAQVMGVLTDNGAIPFLDNELMYLKDNPTVDSPFGKGKMEVAFESVAALLGVQQMAARAGADATARTMLWWETGNMQQNVEVVRRHMQNDLEGQSRIGLMSGMPKPEVVTVDPVTEADTLPGWQEMLIRMIANAFDLSGMALGLERDVNRSTGEVLDDKDFRSAVVPIATKIEVEFTRFILHRFLGYDDIKFKFLKLDDPDTTTLLTQMTQRYNMNAATPNEVYRALGLPVSMSPFADCSQFEMMLLNTEAAGKVQDANASKQFSRQQTAQQQMMEQYGDPSQEEQPSASASASARLPRLGLPKTPMLGSKVNARQVAAMSKKQLEAAMKKGIVTADVDQLTDQMQQQEPGLLLELAPEVIAFLQQLKQQQQKINKKKNAKASPKTATLLKQRFQQRQKEVNKLRKEYARRQPDE